MLLSGFAFGICVLCCESFLFLRCAPGYSMESYEGWFCIFNGLFNIGVLVFNIIVAILCKCVSFMSYKLLEIKKNAEFKVFRGHFIE